MNLTKINIIGMGVVGQALLNNVRPNRMKDIKCYDLDKDFDTFTPQTELKGNVTFVCVNTPSHINGTQDPTDLQNILDILVDKAYTGVVIIKSTVLYENIKPYLNTLSIVMCPEFLTAAKANEDFYNTEYLVFGGKLGRAAYEIHLEIFDFQYHPKPEYCTIKEAIDFKYMRNLHQAYNVLFWEGIQDISGNALKMSQMLENLPVGENSNISQGGYRGFGQSLVKGEPNFSACLHKDARALYKSVGDHPLLKYVNDYNEGLM